MSPTIKDIEHDMTVQVLMERARESEMLARSAVQMVAVLVNKMGGEVTITLPEVEAAVQYDLAQIRMENGAMVLRVERRRPN